MCPGPVTGAPFGLTYASYDLSSKAFCLLWFLSTSWYLTINVVRSRIRNFFRLRHHIKTAPFIQIEQSRKSLDMFTLESMPLNSILARVQKLDALIKSSFGLNYRVSTVPVLWTAMNYPFFEFQSMRYIWNDMLASFEPATIPLPTNPPTLLAMALGLSEEEASRRLEIVGQNFIAVAIPSFVEALWQE
ncbi:hypothetical protein CLU79DRAFT_714825 [Phycomyces nitens]|nr:hypothetical protein CLU79DRAFT_714825 [Phycomyces nitens]